MGLGKTSAQKGESSSTNTHKHRPTYALKGFFHALGWLEGFGLLVWWYE
jgi:hypothetical protein